MIAKVLPLIVMVTAGSLMLARATADTPTPAPLIPRDILFGNPERANVQLSHDGKWISFLAPLDGVLNVWVAPIATPASAVAVTRDTGRGIRSYSWAYTNSHILYTQDRDGDENWHIYSVPLKTGGTDQPLSGQSATDLTPFPNVQARILQTSHHHPEHLLVAVNNRNPQLHDVYRVSVTDGAATLVEQNDQGYAGYIADEQLAIGFAVKMTPDGGSEIHRRSADAWTLLTTVPYGDAMTTQPLGLDESHANLYMLDSRGRNTAALTLLDLNSGKARVVAENAQADIADAISHPTRNLVQAVASNHTRTTWQVIDDSIKGDLAYLATVANGDLSVLTRTQDDGHWIVAYVMDAGPVRYYHYDRSARKASFLFTNRPALEKITLAPMRAQVVKARDGLDLVTYCTLPTWSDADGDGKPAAALPMVLLVHGGPWARDAWGYNPMHQWLANRGYAVMSVNFRGSTGFGKAFINAGDKEWAAKMHDDLLDSVEWAVKSGIADRSRVAIMGGSYGGYATLVGLTYTPETFACGVDIVGPSNLVTLLNSIPPYWAPIVDMFTQRVGDHRTPEGRQLLEERSPLNRVEHIRRPLLIGQGANDPRVKQAESDQIVAAMQRRNIPVTYALFPDEGHGFARPENNLAFNAITEGFLAQHLGGRVEPMSDDLNGSSMTLPAGAEHIPGLPSSLIPAAKPAPAAPAKDPA